ncbi:hypothetical protein M1N08_00085 [Dehalococcoidia bacterium]|nr:hypothetical protein [Dehalococcoidia bacterium]
MADRAAVIKRETGETTVNIKLDIDGTGAFEIDTGVGMLDHLLAQVAKHGRFDIKIRAKGDLEVNEHHTGRGWGEVEVSWEKAD